MKNEFELKKAMKLADPEFGEHISCMLNKLQKSEAGKTAGCTEGHTDRLKVILVTAVMSVILTITVLAAASQLGLLDSVLGEKITYYQYGPFTYTLTSDRTAVITEYIGTYEACSIPGVVNGYTVTSIGGWAFNTVDPCASPGEVLSGVCANLKRLTIPASVTSLEESAFALCATLEEISLPDDLVSIDNQVFYFCQSLKSINIPEGVTSIGQYAFCGCESLTEIILPDNLTSICDGAFYGCSSLIGIHIPDGVTAIGRSAFDGCSSLTGITIPDSVTDIGLGTFLNCNQLTLSVTAGSFLHTYAEKYRVPYEIIIE